MTKPEDTVKLQEGIGKLKEECAKQGWESDEVDEKVAEVFENFPWYKYNGGDKWTWKSILWNLCLFSLVVYLAGGAYLNKNRRLRKNINDKIFDLQIPYHQGRISRWLSLPFAKYFNLNALSRFDCLVNNPFHVKEPVRCEFCGNYTSIPSIKINDEDLDEIIQTGEPIKLIDVPGYHNSTTGFNDVRDLVAKYGEEMDESICEIYLSKVYTKISDYFKLTEEELREKKLSIGWRNCEGYGTRFYRKLFARPSFISNTSEIMLEKFMYILSPQTETVLNDEFPNGSTYIFQVQGESTILLAPPKDCQDSCNELTVDIKAGQVVVYPNEGWNITSKSHGENLSVIYISGFAVTQS